MKRKRWLLLLGCLCLATASCGTKRELVEESFCEKEIAIEEMSPSNVSLQKKMTLAKGKSKTISFDMKGGFFSPDHNSVSIIVEKLEGESYQYILENVTNKETIAKDTKTETFAGTVTGLNVEKKYELTIINLGIEDLTITITMTSFVTMNQEQEETTETIEETTMQEETTEESFENETTQESVPSGPVAVLKFVYQSLPLTINDISYEFQVRMQQGVIERIDEDGIGGPYVEGDVRCSGTYALQLVTPQKDEVITCFDKEFFWEFKKDSDWIWIDDCNGDGRDDMIISQYLSQNVNEYQIYTVTDDLQIVEIGANMIGKNISVKEGTVLCEGYDNSTATYFTTVWKWNEELNHFEREN